MLGKIKALEKKSRLNLLQDWNLEAGDTLEKGHHLANPQRVPFASWSQWMVGAL